MASPDYTVKDLVYWTGLMGGIIMTVTTMRPMGYHHLVNLVCGGIVGLALGHLAQSLYEKAVSPPDHPSQNDDSQFDDSQGL